MKLFKVGEKRGEGVFFFWMGREALSKPRLFVNKFHLIAIIFNFWLIFMHLIFSQQTFTCCVKYDQS